MKGTYGDVGCKALNVLRRRAWKRRQEKALGVFTLRNIFEIFVDNAARTFDLLLQVNFKERHRRKGLAAICHISMESLRDIENLMIFALLLS